MLVTVSPLIDDPDDERLLAIAIDRCGGLSDSGAIVATLRLARFTPATIARLWDRIIAARTPAPAAAEFRQAAA